MWLVASLQNRKSGKKKVSISILKPHSEVTCFKICSSKKLNKIKKKIFFLKTQLLFGNRGMIVFEEVSFSSQRIKTQLIRTLLTRLVAPRKRIAFLLEFCFIVTMTTIKVFASSF